MDQSRLKLLPDELLEQIVFELPPDATLAFGQACKRSNKIAYEHLVWRAHCLRGWKYWEAEDEMRHKRTLPPAQVKWRHLYNERKKIDKQALDTYNELLKTQQHRVQRTEDITRHGYDVKDLFLRIKDDTPDDLEDVLARRYYAGVMLGRIHRETALDKWVRLQKGQMVQLQEALGAFDLFVLNGRKGDLRDIDQEFERIANAIRAEIEGFDELSVRQKAVHIARHLRSQNLVGNPNESDYHALRNNFISIALFDEVHTSLPLQSVAIYCAVARKMGIEADPSNYPSHVHAVIKAPPDHTLDGVERAPVDDAKLEMMHMDPWRSAEEMPEDHLTLRLSQMNVPPERYAMHMGPAKKIEIAMRTGRNIMTSVQETRERMHGASRRPAYPDVESAWYSMVWSMMILGDHNPAATLHRRRQCLPYLADHLQNHFPEDLGLVEKVVVPMFDAEREQQVLLQLITKQRAADRNAKAPHLRNDETKIQYNIGQLFQHRRYGYEGIIVGWDIKCTANERWISQMRVDDLSRGREQPFYNIVADDKSERYVAEDNIERLHIKPCDSLMQLAGRYFKRWDIEKKVFVSNIRDEYPED